ncbi:MAG: DUF2085 domain-containing protein [Candidatus Micrarchaeota archaeon]|nr:DUF2085 domain-containing protein [Candidatus Micrarchaeota archaeon]
MAGSKLPYLLFLAFLLMLNAAVFYVPYAASKGDANAPFMYAAFAPTCHQLTSRSNCLFVSQDGKYSFGDCLQSDKLLYTRADVVEAGAATGYKLPVCSRDVAIYLAMLAGALVLPFVRRVESDSWPDKWLLVAACVPIAIDGFTQLFGLRESSNFLREVTGAIVGFALPFYIVPMLNSLWEIVEEKIAGEKKTKKANI